MQIKAPLHRKAIIDKLTSEEYDLLIIGGGITGAGIALDAASRGLKTALVEKNDFASGTSSRSTKLIHGGLRYLKQFEVALVMEVGRERRIVHNIAPHLVVSEKMLLPFFKKGTFGKFSTSAGLWIYDFLAGVRKADRRKMLTKKQTLAIEPLLPPESLLGSGIYAEYRTDDARLTMEVIKTAIGFGADCVNYLSAEDFIYNDGKISGIKALDRVAEVPCEIFAKAVVSATGPWVDDLREINHSRTGKTLHLTKGVHIVLPFEKMPIRHAIYFDVPDGRMIFAIPRGKITYIGTTDTDYSGDKEKVKTTRADADYLVNAINNAFPAVKINTADIISSWAGLRPLINQAGKKADEISRKDEVFISGTGLISIAGGKLTGYRKMSRKVTNIVSRKLRAEYNIHSAKCKTRLIRLTGYGFSHSREIIKYIEEISQKLQPIGLGSYEAGYLVHNYGIQTGTIMERMEKIPVHDPQLKLLSAELDFCFDFELVVSAMDFLVRRTGRLYFDIESVKKFSEPVLAVFAKHFDWTPAKIQDERRRIETGIYDASHFE